MGQRSRKRRPEPGAERDAAMRRGYARGRERDERIRAELEPYAPGERPPAIKAAVALAALLAISNLALFAAGWEVRGQDQAVTGVLIFCALMIAAAVGMWRMRYWAVLGFQALLGIAVVFAAGSLIVASNFTAVALCLGILAIAGTLFWFLVRVMARIQLPTRRPEERVG
ncbi:MAG: hypothetical protein ABW060_15935 [Solirubrobacteraceae bacterium]